MIHIFISLTLCFSIFKVVADVIKVDKRGDEVKRREEERRRATERRQQIQIEEKRLAGAVWQPRETEDDWFTLMGVSSNDSGMQTLQNKNALEKCIDIHIFDRINIL